MKILSTFITLLACSALAYKNTTLNISSAGSKSAGGNYTNIGTIVPVGGETSQIGTLSLQSGFASGFILQPTTAHGVLPDELNPDNDSDGLDDTAEIVAGSSVYKGDTDGDGLNDADEVLTHRTNPSLADSDSDGMNDPDEMVAGTSPTNQSSVLSLAVNIASDGDAQISWPTVVGHTYNLETSSSITSNDWTAYSEFSGTGDDCHVNDTQSADKKYYRIKVRAD